MYNFQTQISVFISKPHPRNRNTAEGIFRL